MLARILSGMLHLQPQLIKHRRSIRFQPIQTGLLVGPNHTEPARELLSRLTSLYIKDNLSTPSYRENELNWIVEKMIMQMYVLPPPLIHQRNEAPHSYVDQPHSSGQR